MSIELMSYDKSSYTGMWASQVVVKNLPANAEDIKDMGSVPGSGRSPGEEHGSPLLVGRILWTEEPGRVWSMESIESDTTE